MSPVSRGFTEFSSAAPPPPFASEPGHPAGAREAGAADPQQEGPSPPPTPGLWTACRGVWLGAQAEGALSMRTGGARARGRAARSERRGRGRGQQRLEGLAGGTAPCGARRRRRRARGQ